MPGSCSGQTVCSGRCSTHSDFERQQAWHQPGRRRRCRTRCLRVAAAHGMQPFGGLLASQRLRGVSQPISGCMLKQQPLPMGITRLKDRKSVSGTVLVEQPDETMQLQGREALQYSVTSFHAETKLPTRFGQYRVRAYRHSTDGGNSFTEPMVIMTGQPEGQSEVVVRVHDACFTSEVLGSLKCDCAEQLQLAMKHVQQHQPGMVIYLQQEGRGIGLANKIAAYALQEEGYDTVDANRALGYPDDCREYTSVHNILKDLGIKSIRLMTNNPRKMAFLRALGVEVTGRVPCIVEAQQFSEDYLAVKAERMDHDFDGSYCHWNHGGEPLPPQVSVNGSGSDSELGGVVTGPSPTAVSAAPENGAGSSGSGGSSSASGRGRDNGSGSEPARQPSGAAASAA